MGQRVAGYVVPLAACRRGDVDVAGGKGANLGELIHAGFPVPSGFVVTTAAYEAVLRHSGLAGRIEELLAAAPDGSAVQAALRAAELPPGLAAALVDAYRDLTGDDLQRGLAVRSSATAEDMPGATFAGQQETYLNVVGEDAFTEAVRGCWASVWSERALAYRDRHGIAEPSMAVVVQRMVPAESAGVLFTANPVTGAREEVVIDASAGLGEAVVAGLTTPDHAVLDKRSGRVHARRTGRREVVVRARPGGGTERVTARPRVGASTLRDGQLRRLARLGARIERHFGGAQDVEWAWAGGQPYILQTRPVTALPVPPPPRRYPRMFAALIAEVLPVRPYPLDVTTWLGALLDTAGAYSRRLGLGSTPLGVLVTDEHGVVVRLNPPGLRLTWRALLLPVHLRRWAHGVADDAALAAEAESFAETLRRRDLATASWEELLAVVREACTVPTSVIQIRARHLVDALSLLWLWLLLLLLRRGDLLGTLISGTENKTAETDRALDALAGRVRTDPALAGLFATEEPAGRLAGEPAELMPRLAERFPQFLAEVHAFLDRYGHRETASPLLATQPTWRDAPEAVLGLLRTRAAAPPAAPPLRPAWRAAREELLGHPVLRLPPLRRVVMAWLAGARRAFRAREDSRFYLTLPLPVLRASLLELGRRLRSVGVVDDPVGVFHLTLSELERISGWPPPRTQVVDLRATVQRRAAARAALADTPLVDPAWYTPTEVGPTATLPTGETRAASLLHGTPGSPGVAEGPARIILDAAHFDRLHPGDVLITPYTNPAWTPLFPRAAAVVVDTGGVMSHAAIVAREYGIPAVMATGDGTRRLSDGQPVRVDGTRGLVLPA